MRSLRARVALAAAAVLAVFIILTSLALERAFRETARSAREERLLGQLYLLMASAEAENGQLVFPQEPAEPRFKLPNSGLYGRVSDADGSVVWQSASALGVSAPFQERLAPGERRFELRSDSGGRDYFVESFGVNWATGETPHAYTFSVAEDLAEFERQVAGFRTSLAGWLGAMALLMLGTLWVSMRWGLAPLRRVAEGVAAVEAGRVERITGQYPSELQALTENLNALLAHERAQQTRLHNALGDLAHSLKTPLAVLRGAVSEGRLEPETSELIGEQLTRMERIVEYQLHRARAGSAATLAPPVAVRQVADRILATLAKVYRDKGVRAEVNVPAEVALRAVEGDLMELLGNLLDNAYKWCARRVRISARQGAAGTEMLVEDDGPGMDPSQVQRLLERGVRADENTPGHGIGLAVVRDLCEAYGADLRIGRSALGGAAVTVRLSG